MMGRFTEALTPLTKLAGFRKLPEHVLEETQSLLAEIFLQQKNYKSARRHLTAAMALKPLNAEYCYLMAIAFEEDAEADRNHAERYFARAIELDPDEPSYFVDFGAYLFTIDKAKEALKMVRKGYALGLDDAAIVGQVAEVLRREGHIDEATTKLRAALFHHHGAGAFRQLWQHHQFAVIHLQQQKQHVPTSDGPVILPFVPGNKTETKQFEVSGKIIRIDQAEPLDAPRKQEPLPFRRPPRKG
jgi:tetratricopeptide (TPR) repeat protein